MPFSDADAGHLRWRLVLVAMFSFIIIASAFFAARIQVIDSWQKRRIEYEARRDAEWGAIFQRISKLLDEIDARAASKARAAPK